MPHPAHLASFDLEAVFLFTQVVESSSFTAVSEKLRIPKATLSRKIADLEESVGAQLLLRTTRKIQPTDLGREFIQRANTILAAVEDARSLANKSHQEPEGLLRVTAGVEFGLSVLNPLLIQFQKLHPRIQLELDLTGRFVDLATEGFDLGVRIGPLEDSTLSCRKVGSFTYGLYGSQEFIQKQGPFRNVRDVSQVAHLAFSRAERHQKWTLSRGAETETLTVNPRLISNNYSVITRAAEEGLGMAFMPHFLAYPSTSKKMLKNILPEWSSEEIPIQLVFPQQRFISKKLRLLIDFLSHNVTKKIKTSET